MWIRRWASYCGRGKCRWIDVKTPDSILLKGWIFFFWQTFQYIHISLICWMWNQNKGDQCLFCTLCKLAWARSFNSPYNRHSYPHFADEGSRPSSSYTGLRFETAHLTSLSFSFLIAADGFSQCYHLFYRWNWASKRLSDFSQTVV